MGFVHLQGSNKGIPPGPDKVSIAHSMLKKPSKAQLKHPLFARGLDTALRLTVSEEGLLVTVESDKGEVVVMDHPVYKIAFVQNVEANVYFVSKRQFHTEDRIFKCHGFKAGSSDLARELTRVIALTCNTVLKNFRRTRRAVRKRNLANKGPRPGPALETDVLHAAAWAAGEAEAKLAAALLEEQRAVEALQEVMFAALKVDMGSIGRAFAPTAFLSDVRWIFCTRAL
eukprot:m.507853 g.507853  ORF g.507853 m.507853 type:complete len:228 (+) comp57388_c0_seq6:1010-1693(+)